MNQSPLHLIKLSEKNAFFLKLLKNPHQIFYNSSTHITVIVPVHGDMDIKKGFFFAILKQAGIDNRDV